MGWQRLDDADGSVHVRVDLTNAELKRMHPTQLLKLAEAGRLIEEALGPLTIESVAA
jgi:hypothetical protein